VRVSGPRGAEVQEGVVTIYAPTPIVSLLCKMNILDIRERARETGYGRAIVGCRRIRQPTRNSLEEGVPEGGLIPQHRDTTIRTT